ncbi:formimidoylglutamase [Fodinibius sediminis]|uniref:Formiminoglutamase n=1 Tax=Fodinibius sediminis TaxID=1214077 RepID=A0A521AQ97_9BACT|nr:formimidoylglutamase [Fodinibius sediminis]SMO36955.1 formiminoglutamase [Fodinibius sediminis]
MQPSTDIPETAPDDPRLARWLRSEPDEGKPGVVLVGFPSDEGVKRNDGRAGASAAPGQIRRQLYAMTPDAEDSDRFIKLLEHTNDVGDVPVSGDLQADQLTLGTVIARYLEQGIIPIIMGGGHETAYGHFLGYAENGFATSILNVDAHTDVRPLKEGRSHSGSTFRQALEHGSQCAETYLVAGLQPHAVAASHLAFIDRHRGHYLFRDETNITSISGLFHSHESDRLMATFDMDAVDQSCAPGVSAPCTNGLLPDLWLTAAYLAGRNKQVTSFDISELNPEYDRDGQTARLAALTIWQFMLGLSQRS